MHTNSAKLNIPCEISSLVDGMASSSSASEVIWKVEKNDFPRRFKAVLFNAVGRIPDKVRNLSCDGFMFTPKSGSMGQEFVFIEETSADSVQVLRPANPAMSLYDLIPTDPNPQTIIVGSKDSQPV